LHPPRKGNCADCRRTFRRTAKDRFDASQQLLHAERLHHVVVCSELETVHPIGLLPACGENDNGDTRSIPLQCLQDIEAASARQHEIEQEKIESGLKSQSLSRLPVGSFDNLVSTKSKRVRHSPANRAVVFDD
jgi:hypothetical protein